MISYYYFTYSFLNPNQPQKLNMPYFAIYFLCAVNNGVSTEELFFNLMSF